MLRMPVRLTAVLALLVVLAAGLQASAQNSLPPDLAREAKSGTLTLLGGAAVTGLAEQPTISLSRVTPQTAAQEDGAIIAGPELWVVERGTLALTDEAGAVQTATAGQQLVPSGQGLFRVALAGDACPSALRLTLTFAPAMRMSSDLTAPALATPAANCAPGGGIFASGEYSTAPGGDAFAFIARLTLAAQTVVFDRAFSGPVGMAVEAGQIDVSGIARMEAHLTAGGAMVLDRGLEHGLFVAGDEPATLLLAGVISSQHEGFAEAVAGTPQAGVQGTHYLSPVLGYGVSWDFGWTVAGQSVTGSDDSVHLNNGTSDLYFQGYSQYGEEPKRCVETLAQRLKTTPAYTNVVSMTTPAGDPILGSEDGRAYAVFTFTYTPDGGNPVDYAEYIECRSIVPGVSTLVITHVAPVASYAEQAPLVAQVLATLTMP